MSQTLGEKLREAREARDISIGEVAEQTRISPHYVESIERDDYKPLPGGIFNKGFVKSIAKYVGVDEQEALADYARQAAAAEMAQSSEQVLYRPEVLTDDHSGRSMVPTVITAILILAIMTAAVLLGLRYLNSKEETVHTAPQTPANSAANSNTQEAPQTAGVSQPAMGAVKMEFKTTTQPVRVETVVDGEKRDDVVAAGSTVQFDPKESITFNYNRWNSAVVQLSINGKPITLPSEPIGNPKGQRIEFTINKDNLSQIYSGGAIVSGTSPANTAAPTDQTPAAPAVRKTPAPLPAKPTAANTAAAPAANTSGNGPAANTKPAPPKTTATPKPAAPPVNRSH